MRIFPARGIISLGEIFMAAHRANPTLAAVKTTMQRVHEAGAGMGGTVACGRGFLALSIRHRAPMRSLIEIMQAITGIDERQVAHP